MDPNKILIQLHLIHNDRRLCLYPLQNSKSAIAKDFSQVLLDGELKKDFVVCNTCHLVLKFVSIDRSYSALKAHRNRCQGKINSAQIDQQSPQLQPQTSPPQPQPRQIRLNQAPTVPLQLDMSRQLNN